MPVLIHFYDKPALCRYLSILHRYVYTHIYTYLCTYIYFPEGMFTYFLSGMLATRMFAVGSSSWTNLRLIPAWWQMIDDKQSDFPSGMSEVGWDHQKRKVVFGLKSYKWSVNVPFVITPEGLREHDPDSPIRNAESICHLTAASACRCRRWVGSRQRSLARGFLERHRGSTGTASGGLRDCEQSIWWERSQARSRWCKPTRMARASSPATAATATETTRSGTSQKFTTEEGLKSNGLFHRSKLPVQNCRYQA